MHVKQGSEFVPNGTYMELLLKFFSFYDCSNSYYCYHYRYEGTYKEYVH
jgi:hypothetical protein